MKKKTSSETMIPLQRAYWNGLADEYQRITRISEEDFHYGPQLPGEAQLKLLPELRAGMRALELGCGAAQNSVYLAKRGLDCTALDISSEQIRHAKEGAARAGVAIRFVTSPVEHFVSNVEGAFEFIHSSHALEFVDAPQAVLKAVYEALTPGGVFVFSTVHPLYNGEWIGDEEDDACENGADFAVENEDGIQERGLFLTNYFSPPDDVRYDDAGNPVVISRAYPISAWFDWLRAAGFEILRFAEPKAVPYDETPPYTSDAWAEPDGELLAIPGTLVFVARK